MAMQTRQRRRLLVLLVIVFSAAKLSLDFAFFHFISSPGHETSKLNSLLSLSLGLINPLSLSEQLAISRQASYTGSAYVHDDPGDDGHHTNRGNSSPYAYAFVLSGCSQEQPRYKGFLFNILVATRVLREEGSSADVVVFVQLSFAGEITSRRRIPTTKTKTQTLPDEDVRLLTSMGIQIRYIPSSPYESFYESALEKFRILQLTEYRRVMLLDADILPLANLDYLFDMSLTGTLKENIVIAGRSEPALGALFVLTPRVGDYEQILDIIRQREESASQLPSGQHKFDEQRGWGHVIVTPDRWRSRTATGTKWNFRFAFADQGLLYYYTKHVKQSVSILYGTSEVENWVSVQGKVQLENTLSYPFENKRTLRFTSRYLCRQFFCDVAHFGGDGKPWWTGPTRDVAQPVDISAGGPVAARIWWHKLYELNHDLNIGLDFDHWDKENQKPLLGLYPTFGEMDERVSRRAAAPPLVEATDSNKNPAPVDAQRPAKYAVCFVIGGCDSRNNRYKGFLFNILVSTRVLREEGSKADVVAFFQMSYKSGATTLPEEDVQWLKTMGVKVEYIPPSQSESFYDLVMQKFRILSLTQYRRVLLLDGDVMPLANVDPFFELTDGEDAVLKDNVIVTGVLEPANGGLFMLSPGEGEWDRVQEIIKQREENAANISDGRKFDEVRGWGHQIVPPDKWETRYNMPWIDGDNETFGLRWNFHFAFSDQGLLYHYTKYVRKSVSMLTGYGGTTAQNWGAAINGTVVLESTVEIPAEKLSKPRIHLKIQCKKFLCGFSHFTTNNKPWLTAPTGDMLLEKNQNKDARYIWWDTLRKLNEDLHMGLDFEKWKGGERPSLGLYAKFEDLDRRVHERVKSRAE